MSSFGMTGAGASIGNGLAKAATSFNESNLRAPTGGAIGSMPQNAGGGQDDDFNALLDKYLPQIFGQKGTTPQGTRIAYDSPPPAPKKQIGIGYDL